MDERLEFRLANNIDISMRSLNQSFTYEGLLEGTPTKEMNAKKLKWLREQPNKSYLDPVPHYIVPPIETVIPYDRPYPFGTPAELPRVTCVANFECIRVDMGMDYSALTIVWFQDRFAFPIDEQIVKHLLQLDWMNIAAGVAY